MPSSVAMTITGAVVGFFSHPVLIPGVPAYASPLASVDVVVSTGEGEACSGVFSGEVTGRLRGGLVSGLLHAVLGVLLGGREFGRSDELVPAVIDESSDVVSGMADVFGSTFGSIVECVSTSADCSIVVCPPTIIAVVGRFAVVLV